VAFRAWDVPVVGEVHPFLCACSDSMDSSLCHCSMEGSYPFDFPEPLPGVFLSQPSHLYAREKQQPGSSLLQHRCMVS